MQTNGIDVVPIIMIVVGGVLYHLSQKSTPATVDPFLPLCISFGLACVACLVLFTARHGFSSAQIHRVNWTSLALALALVLIESGYLVGYRAGLKLNITSFACNILISLALVLAGTFLYRENFTLKTGSGMILCVAGLSLMWR